MPSGFGSHLFNFAARNIAEYGYRFILNTLEMLYQEAYLNVFVSIISAVSAIFPHVVLVSSFFKISYWSSILVRNKKKTHFAIDHKYTSFAGSDSSVFAVVTSQILLFLFLFSRHDRTSRLKHYRWELGGVMPAHAQAHCGPSEVS